MTCARSARQKSGFERKFYDLGRVNYWGPQSRGKVDFGFDGSRSPADMSKVIDVDWLELAKIRDKVTQDWRRQIIPLSR